MMTQRSRIVFGLIWTAIYLSMAVWLSDSSSSFWRFVSSILYFFAATSIYYVVFGGSDTRCPNCGTKGKHKRDRNSEATAKELDKILKTHGMQNPLSGCHYFCKACGDSFSESEAISFAELANKYGEEFALNEYKSASE